MEILEHLFKEKLRNIEAAPRAVMHKLNQTTQYQLFVSERKDAYAKKILEPVCLEAVMIQIQCVPVNGLTIISGISGAAVKIAAAARRILVVTAAAA